MANDFLNHIVEIVSSNRVLTGVLATAVVGVAWTLNDYSSWKAFGTGGTPPTPSGYWRMTKIRFNHMMSSNNLIDVTPLSEDGPKYLKVPVPTRAGGRPSIMPRTMPQRQRPEKIDPATRERLLGLMRKLQAEHSELLFISPSKTEGFSTDGLYAKKDLETLNPIAKDKILDHEIAHAHPAENSLHVWLSDPDARAVIEAGWGQRFPLPFVKSGWTMVYAPRDEAELDVVEDIVKAGIGWITGVGV